MRKGIIIWLLILTASVATVMLTAPDDIFSDFFADKQETKNCHASVACTDTPRKCNVCGENWGIFHDDLVRIGCYTLECTKCKAKIEDEQHTKWCVNVNYCMGCGMETSELKQKEPNHHELLKLKSLGDCIVGRQCDVCKQYFDVHEQHARGKMVLLNTETCEVGVKCARCDEIYTTQVHNMETVEQPCKTIQKCTFCDYITESTYAKHEWTGKNCFSAGYCKKCGIQGTGVKHNWVPVDCGEETYCSVCGIDGGRTRYPRHNFEPSFFRVFNECTNCGRKQYETANFDWGAILAEVLGVLLIAFGFQYAIRKRKYMHLSWLIVIFLWLEENTFFGNFCPAVLWKKKLD